MKIFSKLKLIFIPTEDTDAVNKKYVDDIISSSAWGTSTYYGSVSLINDNSIIFTINDIDASKITTHTLLILKSDASTSITDSYAGNININSTPTSFSIIDKNGNTLSYQDIINNGTIVLGFNGEDFVLLNKQYLLDSYTSESTDHGATANSVKTVYDHFTEAIGDIPEVLDAINRKVV